MTLRKRQGREWKQLKSVKRSKNQWAEGMWSVYQGVAALSVCIKSEWVSLVATEAAFIHSLGDVIQAWKLRCLTKRTHEEKKISLNQRLGITFPPFPVALRVQPSSQIYCWLLQMYHFLHSCLGQREESFKSLFLKTSIKWNGFNSSLSGSSRRWLKACAFRFWQVV